ncbi:hypothetical protein IBO59_003311 [Salmonella enterica]|nr:hypothetical protein [Salmonella enterica]
MLSNCDLVSNVSPLLIFCRYQMKCKSVSNVSPRYIRRFPVARVLPAPVWEIRLDEIKFTDNTLGFGKKLHWLRDSRAQQA